MDIHFYSRGKANENCWLIIYQRGSKLNIYTCIYNKYNRGFAMSNFEALEDIDDFCKVLVKKTIADTSETGDRRELETDKAVFEREYLNGLSETETSMGIVQPELEEPLIDVFDEGDNIRILVQCRCREQQVTFHPSKDGIIVCKEECNKNKGGAETCRDVCRKLSIRTDGLQLENMLFVIAKCNNNNTLEATIPKVKK
jgi:hypothetical protein